MGNTIYTNQNCLSYLKSLPGNIPQGASIDNWGYTTKTIAVSENGKFQFKLQDDANLCIYPTGNNNASWVLSWIPGIPHAESRIAGYVVFQTDGNLVYYLQKKIGFNANLDSIEKFLQDAF
jgi:hypothetical protein